MKKNINGFLSIKNFVQQFSKFAGEKVINLYDIDGNKLFEKTFEHISDLEDEIDVQQGLMVVNLDVNGKKFHSKLLVF